MKEKVRYFLPKLKNHLLVEKAKVYEKLPIESISLRGIDICGGKEDFVNRLQFFLGKDLNKSVQNCFEKNLIIDIANRVYDHFFDCLGSENIYLNPIRWNIELKTGYEWPKGIYYLKLRALTPKGNDIKMPWELSRCHHLLWLGEAYEITNDEKYAKEIIDQINNWIDENPLMYTVNWTCSMEVAIRAINWMYALLFIKKSESFNDIFADKVYRSLYQHLFFINNNLEKNVPYSNNHYVSDIVGLLYLGAFFSTNKKGRNVLKFAKKEYFKETLVEVLPSGVNYEKSISYHRLMAELLVYSNGMLKRIGENIPENVEERLVKMLEYVGYYSVGNSSPLIADNDNGRLLPFVPRDFKDHTYLIDDNSLERKIVNNSITPLNITIDFDLSKVFVDANVAILKRKKGYVFVSCSSRWKFDNTSNKFTGTHLHNDLLSFVYCHEGREIIVDAGTFCYTSNIEKRNEFRSTMKHNTIIVDNEEQNILDSKSAFGMKYNCCAKQLEFFDNVDSVSIKGEYKTIMGRLVHQRIYNLYDNELQINDSLYKSGQGHAMYMSFHFANDVDVCLNHDNLWLNVGERQYKMHIECKNMLELSLKDDTISPSFGKLKNSKTLVIRSQFDNEIKIKTIISYYTD